jgi:hypothetical protein
MHGTVRDTWQPLKTTSINCHHCTCESLRWRTSGHKRCRNIQRLTTTWATATYRSRQSRNFLQRCAYRTDPRRGYITQRYRGRATATRPSYSCHRLRMSSRNHANKKCIKITALTCGGSSSVCSWMPRCDSRFPAESSENIQPRRPEQKGTKRS